ncbi:hypothetical protein C343_02669 [Cryptococcus neoformans C23]|uniref:Zn(2)-C6 fungal-type domain-containing protein n=1 Tax=Cryptococcus neoformans (strain H99 / ATCC 208821 / CBS 10515 / FGSC 9487) TaxID=235443 RepID=J9VSA5_CRYN9|nr:hypothetical protein CNAG_07830 [Cryptococcus neoformans var. grubii H99]AUB24266.1 hypothetical protein CKF44_07830 [Cryptococcus neoformans var. grubii]OWZ32939.1 hypothetical protein C347_02737 [Cryptococcus neoformans var. grubii AD2-60a]OWZ45050.1 hypothetical protein C343_02669 [Cryptococcus neoformans var. grubii C23]OWZ54935.1 hypothetical protein C368_03165 [Cryptococcus neoformans var. grubii 125.91]OXC85312.1 hypothetical protein C344_02434 [Cryptococcus neoformans var. grubii AD|eukprot:XP_012048596.1 hypothetical protein CNAG_07830 [Cryptococcus neoformans var. grubii H99]
MPILTCDQCRARKVRCMPPSEAGGPSSDRIRLQHGSKCLNCDRRKEDCTYDYTPKKTGRPRARGTSSRRAPSTSSNNSLSRRSISPSMSALRQNSVQALSLNPPQIASPRAHRSPSLPSHRGQLRKSPPTASQTAALRVRHSTPNIHHPGSPANFNFPIDDRSFVNPPVVESLYDSFRHLLGTPLPLSFDFTIPSEAEAQVSGQATAQAGYKDPHAFLATREVTENDLLKDRSPLVTQPPPDLAFVSQELSASPTSQTVGQCLEGDGMSALRPSPSQVPWHGLGQSPFANDSHVPNGLQSLDFGGSSSSGIPSVDLQGMLSCDGRTEWLGNSRVISTIESVASWDEVGFFLSLYLKYQHPLLPLVHRPTFAQDVLHRRDRNDEAFRGLLLSIVAYTICHTNARMLEQRMDRARQETLFRRCQRGSRMIQIRHQMKPSLVILASTILDWVTSQSASAENLPENLISDVRRLVYSLKLNQASPHGAKDLLEVEMCRKLYWVAYDIDKTNAMYLNPVAIQDSEGVPPLPLEVDDDFITRDDMLLIQPGQQHSYMVGFNCINRLFQILSQCMLRQRLLNSAPSFGFNVWAHGEWVQVAMNELRQILADLPPQLQSEAESREDSLASFNGTQAANICITALCVEMALLDLKVRFSPDMDIRQDRQSIAQRVFQQLQRIPIECLARNGESMRGKVAHVVLSLLDASQDTSVTQEDSKMGESLWNWWNMYSRVLCLQVIPDRPASAVPTRPCTPVRRRS